MSSKFRRNIFTPPALFLYGNKVLQRKQATDRSKIGNERYAANPMHTAAALIQAPYENGEKKKTFY